METMKSRVGHQLVEEPVAAAVEGPFAGQVEGRGRQPRRPRRRPAITVALAACWLVGAVVLAACGRSTPVSSKASGPTGRGEAGAAVVTRIVDGDTIAVRLGSSTENVRLIGIDTPESVKPNTPVQCFAREASARTKALLPAGTKVRLERDVEARDQYRRLLAYVYRMSDGLFVNLSLAQDGFAVLYTIPPNVAHVDEFGAAAAAARDASLGLWGTCGDDIPHHRSAPLPSPP
jgi:micrococcal nuclease